MKTLRKLIIANVFQIGVNIIGLPEFHYIIRRQFYTERPQREPKSKYHA